MKQSTYLLKIGKFQKIRTYLTYIVFDIDIFCNKSRSFVHWRSPTVFWKLCHPITYISLVCLILYLAQAVTRNQKWTHFGALFYVSKAWFAITVIHRKLENHLIPLTNGCMVPMKTLQPYNPQSKPFKCLFICKCNVW